METKKVARKEERGKKDTKNRRSDSGDQGRSSSGALPFELQQLVLNIFQNTHVSAQSLHRTDSMVQEVKQHLYNRDFASAFGKEAYLEAYAYRWSSSRALAYLDIFNGLADLICGNEDRSFISSEVQSHAAMVVDGRDLSALPLGRPGLEAPPVNPSAKALVSTKRVVCIGGGGGAEIVALAGLANTFQASSRFSSRKRDEYEDDGRAYEEVKLAVTVIDVAEWGSVLGRLQTTVTSPPKLSKYASDASRSKAAALLPPDRIEITFERSDVLDILAPGIGALVGTANIITIMFTLNELFTSSLTKTTQLLFNLTDVLDRGALLLIVDSPGSYSEVKLGQEPSTEVRKRYPMKWLLDHTLLEVANAASAEDTKWEKLVGDDSRWFRLDQRLRYPIDLENIRYQIHLYRKL